MAPRQDGDSRTTGIDGSGPGLAASLGAIAGRGARALSSLIVPAVCLACHARVAMHDAVCANCWREIAFIRPPLCDRLGLPMPFGGNGPLVSAAAAADPPVYGKARAVAAFDPVMRRLVHRMKYSDRHDARRLFGRWLADAGRDLLEDAHLLVPVPLSRWRLIRRQFNQAAILAHEVSALTGVRADSLALLKTRTTPPQVGLNRSERRRNVRAAFAVPGRKRSAIEGRNIIVIDDVITTGATVEAATRALLAAGAARVDVLALALVTTPGDVTL